MTYETREDAEDTGAIQTFAVMPPDDPNLEIENPDVAVDRQMAADYTAAEILVAETAWMNAQNEFTKNLKEQKNYPRIDVMVDKNCLISYTGHMVDFDHEGFMEILDKVIMARIDIEGIDVERAKAMPRDTLEQTGYQ